jgi:hypothetical protein
VHRPTDGFEDRERTNHRLTLTWRACRGRTVPVLGRRFKKSDLSNLLEVREPAGRRDVALETDDPSQESSSDQT